ncbi:hypothetical protein PML95_00135 [Vagococcus lutrae]|uniref:Polymerase n=1 Tax=Vagococcus lutrae TaxID=81947 RepID=A0AAE9XEJ2_9ENTE|nr:hypothetical protein [Vagococcus lutrae]WCG22712.1 hypothetical protein PML95_00135 [Vagococcus lutrae]
MQINKGERLLDNTKSKSEMLFYLGYFLALVASFLKHSMIEIPNSVSIYLNVMSIFIVSFFLLIRGLKKDYFMETLFLVTISIFSFLSIKNIDIVSYIFIIIASQHLEFKKIMQFFFTVIFICLMVVIFLAKLSIIPNLIFYQSDRVRVSLGTIYPTVLASYFFFLILSYLLVREKKVLWIELLIIFLLNLWVLKLTDARSSFLNTTILLIGVSTMKLIRYNLKASKLMRIILRSSVVGVPLLVIYLSYNYRTDSQLYHFLNNALTGRLFYANKAFYMYNINLFGQDILMNGSGRNSLYGHEYFYLDSLAIEQMFSKGLVLLTFYIGATYKILKKFLDNNKWTYAFVLLIITLYDITDNKSFRISFNPMLLALFATVDEYGGDDE